MDNNGGDNDTRYTAADQPAQAGISQDAPLFEMQDDFSMHWKASEFIDHQKSAVWLLGLAAIGFVVAIILYFLTKNIFSSVVLILAAISFGMFAFQKPRTLDYTLLPNNIKVGQKTYSYDDFRTFSIMQEGAFYSIFLEPVKRFMPPLTIYFAAEDGERIFDILASRIPHQEKLPDPIERLMQRIRF